MARDGLLSLSNIRKQMPIDISNAQNIARVLTEALPYIRRFSGKTFVVKYKYGSQWYEYHTTTKDKAFEFITRKAYDPKMGVAIVKTK